MIRTFLYLWDPQEGIVNEGNQQYKRRLQNKIRLVLKKELELLALYSKKGEEALQTPPLNWLHWIEETDFYTGPYLYLLPCCVCKRDADKCYAWIALHCAGCNKIYWYSQKTLANLWCRPCFGKWIQDFVWVRALEQSTGLPGRAGLELFESTEQVAIAYMRWKLQQVLGKLEIITSSHIVAARCKADLPLNLPHAIPVNKNADLELDQCIQKLTQPYNRHSNKPGKR